jgi:hypothetical protein
MNIRRGMFRIWVLFTAAWVIGCVAWGYGEMGSDSLDQRAFMLPSEKDPVSPVEFWQTHALKRTYTQIDLPYEVLLLVHPPVSRETALTHSRVLTAHQTPIRQAELRGKRFAFFALASGMAFGVPAAMLAIGAALAWAMSGFKKTA